LDEVWVGRFDGAVSFKYRLLELVFGGVRGPKVSPVAPP
jgi:hypothetical protein